MKIVYSWLKEYVDFPYSPSDLVDIFENLGIEVEDFYFAGEGLKDKIFACIVRNKYKHPGYDKLFVYEVEGLFGVKKVVASVADIQIGDKLIIALPGAKLKDFVVQSKKFKNIVSEAVFVGEDEIGVSDEHKLMFLPKDFDIERDILTYLGLNDWVYELAPTPNRPDLLGVIGIAYEIKAKTGNEIKFPRVGFEEDIEEIFPVEIRDKKICLRYTARIIKDVKVEPSPLWLKVRLSLCGFRPINNLVDISNYVMLEFGHPIHFFDLRKIGKKIIVRRSLAGERFVSLEGKEYNLPQDIPVISNENDEILALAGIIGGKNSGVLSDTTDILIESAWFDPVFVRKAAQLLGIDTESKRRFERIADLNVPPLVSSRASYLVKKICGGKIGKLNDVAFSRPKKISLTINLKDINEYLGEEISKEEVLRIFKNLSFDIEDKGNEFKVLVPTFRRDIKIEVDLIEEVARVYGYDKIKSSPSYQKVFIGKKVDKKEWLDEILRNFGFYEVKTLGLVSAEENWFGDGLKPVKIKNPLSVQHSYLRTSLIPGLLQVVAFNVRRGENVLKFYERGRVFGAVKKRDLPLEIERISAVCGGIFEKRWDRSERMLDFYDLKSVVDEISQKAGGFDYKEINKDFLEVGIEVLKDGKPIGWAGLIKKEILDFYKIPYKIYAFEFDMENLVYSPHYVEISEYPPVYRHLSVVMPEKSSVKPVIEIFRKCPILVDYYIMDVYKGQPLKEGEKSITFNLKFQSFEKTLSDKEVNSWMDRIISEIKQVYKIRE